MGKKIFLACAVVALLILFFAVGCERINAGNVGIKVNMTGGDRGVSKTEYVTGWVPYWKWASSIYEFPISQQHIEYKNPDDSPEAFIIAAAGGTKFTLHPSFNYALNAGEAADMFQKLRGTAKSMEMLENTYIKNAMRVALREATNRFTVDSILNNISNYDAAITEALNLKLAPYFTVSQFTSNLMPDESLTKTLAAKALAIQEALQLENEQRKIKVQAENDLIEARRDSAVKVTAALAEARSIKEVQAALATSPQFVEKIKAEKWNGALPQYMLGSNTSMFMSLPKN